MTLASIWALLSLFASIACGIEHEFSARNQSLSIIILSCTYDAYRFPRWTQFSRDNLHTCKDAYMQMQSVIVDTDAGCNQVN